MYFEDEETGGRRPRAQKQLLRVTFADGTVFCYKSPTMTYVEALRKIGVDKLQDIHLEFHKLPLFSREIYKGHEKDMKLLDNGWYVFACGNSAEKYLRLKSIINQLGEDVKVEIGEDFETSNVRGFSRAAKKVDGLLIQFADGEFIGGESPKDSFIQAIEKIGTDIVCYKGFEERGQELVTRYNKFKGQVQSGDKWITIPGQTKDKIHALERISQKLNLGLKITIID